MAEKKSTAPQFQHNYTPMSERPVVQEKHDSDNTMVERAGYVPMEKRIKSIMGAGQRLDQARRVQYHYGEGEAIYDNFSDFAPDTNLDITDIGGVVDNGRDALQANAYERKRTQEESTVQKRKKLKKELDQLEQQEKAAEPAEPAKSAKPAPGDGESST